VRELSQVDWGTESARIFIREIVKVKVTPPKKRGPISPQMSTGISFFKDSLSPSPGGVSYTLHFILPGLLLLSVH
jgi:hypothetical protein